MSKATIAKPEEGRQYWRPRTLAQSLGVSSRWIYGELYSGRLRGTRINDRVWLIEAVDVVDWLAKNGKPNVERPAA